ncbi:ATP-binding cassette domain-containing protein [Thermasporomyces composti]|uniref:ATP-binding cassette domain-containing protein n=1 Tax=Thermasporomyces composti TaxID=696763 RepID=UPI003CCC4E9A
MTDTATRKVATYSGGMRRWRDIAMSMIGSPPIVLLDEPTTGARPAGAPRRMADRQETRREWHDRPPHLDRTTPGNSPTGSRSPIRAGSCGRHPR